jgi:putative beta-lysine N-acetyltransferase
MNVFKGEMSMQDKIEIIGTNSTIQHGELNKRIYLIKLDERDVGNITSLLNTLAREQSYSKIFCKVPAWAAPVFNADGFIMEAFIPGFYSGTGGVCFMSKFLNSDRLLGIENDTLMEFSRMLRAYRPVAEDSGKAFSEKNTVTSLKEEDADEITEVYKRVFKSYPFPIHDPNYIRKTMRDHIRYFGIRERGKLIALSSAEMDTDAENAEMTDFATLQEARGKGAAYHLLGAMEKKMKAQGILTFYTIARLNSLPMNKTFLKHGYAYSGTLINNTNIAGNIESMNVLFKHVK